jgi:hypothetical protein
MSRELQLLPAEGQPHLSPEETLRRLRAEFRFVEIDHERGKTDLLDGIALWERTSPRALELGPNAKGTGEARKAALLETLRAALPDACHVSFGDDPEHAQGHSLVPGGNGVLIVVEQDWQATLADRCARALGYVVHEI